MGIVKPNGSVVLNGSKPGAVAERALADPVEQKLKAAAEDAVDYLHAVVKAEETGSPGRIDSAKSILDRSGYGAQSRIAAPPIKAKKDLSDMTADDLRSIANTLQRELSNRAKVIEHEPGAPSDASGSEDIADLLG